MNRVIFWKQHDIFDKDNRIFLNTIEDGESSKRRLTIIYGASNKGKRYTVFQHNSQCVDDFVSSNCNGVFDRIVHRCHLGKIQLFRPGIRDCCSDIITLFIRNTAIFIVGFNLFESKAQNTCGVDPYRLDHWFPFVG